MISDMRAAAKAQKEAEWPGRTHLYPPWGVLPSHSTVHWLSPGEGMKTEGKIAGRGVSDPCLWAGRQKALRTVARWDSLENTEEAGN